MRPALAAVLAAVAAGCGGGDDKREPARTDTAKREPTAEAVATPARPTRAEFIRAADRVCKDANRDANRRSEQFQRIASRATDPARGLAEAEPILREGLEEQREHVRRFSALTPPAGDERAFRRMLDGARDQNALLGRLLDAAEKRDIGRVVALIEDQQRLRERNRSLLQGYGLKECGIGAGP